MVADVAESRGEQWQPTPPPDDEPSVAEPPPLRGQTGSAVRIVLCGLAAAAATAALYAGVVIAAREEAGIWTTSIAACVVLAVSIGALVVLAHTPTSTSGLDLAADDRSAQPAATDTGPGAPSTAESPHTTPVNVDDVKAGDCFDELYASFSHRLVQRHPTALRARLPRHPTKGDQRREEGPTPRAWPSRHVVRQSGATPAGVMPVVAAVLSRLAASKARAAVDVAICLAVSETRRLTSLSLSMVSTTWDVAVCCCWLIRRTWSVPWVTSESKVRPADICFAPFSMAMRVAAVSAWMPSMMTAMSAAEAFDRSARRRT